MLDPHSPNHGNRSRDDASGASSKPSLPSVPPSSQAPESHIPTSTDPLPLAELRPALPVHKLEVSDPAVVAVREHQEEHRKSSPVTPVQWIKRGIVSIFGSSESYSSVGNLLISLDSLAGIIGHPICGLYSVWNQFRSAHLSNREVQPLAEQAGAESKWQPLRDIMASPGIYRMGLSVTYALSTVEAFSRGLHALGTAFALCSVANMAAARLINHDYWERLKDRRSYQHPIEALWKVVPSRLQSLLANPAPIWCAADLIVGAVSIPTTSLTSPWVVGSMAISLAGIVTGILPSFTRSGFTRPSPTSLVLNAATNASWGVTNLLLGSPRFGIALCLWAITSSILAARQLKSTASSNNLSNL